MHPAAQRPRRDADRGRPAFSVEGGKKAKEPIAMVTTSPTEVANIGGADLYHIDDLLAPEERAVRDRVRSFMDAEVLPVINDYWERAAFPFELVPKLAQLGICGGSIHGYGCPGLSTVATGLMSQELSRGDASIATFFGVQSGLAMGTIHACGSEEQRRRWLPPMARMDVIGAFGLTEPDVGSDAGHPRTRAVRQGDCWVLDGEKRWIGNASIADVTIIWARDDDGHVGGFLVERGTPGFTASTMTGKLAQRAVWQAAVTLSKCRIPLENRLAKATTFRAASGVLMQARTGVAWGALGHAMACYEAALAYTTRREQFGKPIAAFQLVQEKLVRMLAAVTRGQLMCLRVSQLVDAGKLSHAAASLAKFSVARDAREVAQLARDVMGGNGILLENHVARHLADLEAVFTYEGTDHINALVVGREITGLNAIV